MDQEPREEQMLAMTPGTMMPAPDLKREVRTYVDTIIGYLHLLKEDATEAGQEPMPPEYEQIWIAANQLAALVEDA